MDLRSIECLLCATKMLVRRSCLFFKPCFKSTRLVEMLLLITCLFTIALSQNCMFPVQSMTRIYSILGQPTKLCGPYGLKLDVVFQGMFTGLPLSHYLDIPSGNYQTGNGTQCKALFSFYSIDYSVFYCSCISSVSPSSHQ
jgi:hypothetical protein